MVNLLFFVMTLFPIPTLDGAVILHELRNWKEDQTAR
jgi:Zn-dependent protease